MFMLSYNALLSLSLPPHFLIKKMFKKQSFVAVAVNRRGCEVLDIKDLFHIPLKPMEHLYLTSTGFDSCLKADFN